MSTTSKISFQELKQRLLDVDIPDEELAPYFIIHPEQAGPFNPVLLANPELVTMTGEEFQAESAMGIGNGLARFRRQLRFKRGILRGDKRPVIVTEGDSWFQFPLLIDDVVDYLEEDYLVCCLSAAGDTAQNMVFGTEGHGKREFLSALRQQKDRVRAFVFSGAGNDIIGEDENGVPVLASILKDFQPGKSAADHINFAVLGDKLDFLKRAYLRVFQTIHGEPGLETLPIVIHGYDHAIPWNPNVQHDPRNPKWAKKDEWLGRPLKDRNIMDPGMQRAIIALLIDALYDMLSKLADSHANVHLVNARGALPEVTHWADEIHGTSDGFRDVAVRFKAVLRFVIHD
jgi:hypothetical protein